MQPDRSPALRIADRVRDAVDAGRPVLALESTILTHGLPSPRNLEVGLATEALVREAGVEPATIGVVGGTAVVGLDEREIERLCTVEGIVKASTRDLPVARAAGLDAGTTVAATAWLAHRAGIRVFSTGGLGGVHRGASDTFDESTDLPALAATPIVVVSAGVKSILDVGATLERLETLGITVLGYRTDRFPGFYVADSGFAAPASVDSAAEAAAVARGRDELGLASAVLVANPVAESDQLDPDEHLRVLAEALAAADAAGVTGHDTTPFLLDFVLRATGGRSLEANLAVYRGNALLGAEIARELAG
ncbi:pseudouridine-5'-phosphate glycosidase [Agromyces marinus]|uniref:Pseudouridine-5'-phosphate glycosidase n=1 Tax=Agromyces marinus TaxID=1389020 RepID=A0ABN6Y9W9_9MICO|nr:pseudouridine-5'-phosphate glycosidase [Agromyces marinus]UIP57971.1 Pseudouridine-5'-phosphate glycosidase [Agromyces marinus]BDZ53826.1 pseudouridine-5'-phosphate glycosidase [Agromyces marinus]